MHTSYEKGVLAVVWHHLVHHLMVPIALSLLLTIYLSG